MDTQIVELLGESARDLGLSYPKVIGNTDAMTEDEWRAQRRRGIGGSDAASAAGLSRWKSRYVLFQDKAADFEIIVEENRRMTLGKIFEAPIAETYAMDTERQILRLPVFLQHPDLPWMLANVDRFVLGDDGKISGALECKMTDDRMRDLWQEGEAPIEHQLQCIHYMAVTGLPWVDLTALVGRETKNLRIERDEKAIADLIDIEDKFWKLVEANTPPAVTEGRGAASTMALLKKMYAGSDPDLPPVVLPEEMRPLIESRVSMVAQRKTLKEAIEGIDIQLCELLGPSEVGVMPSGEIAFTWKGSGRKGYYVEPTEFRTPRVPKAFTANS